MASFEKPLPLWYLPAIKSFLLDDVRVATGVPLLQLARDYNTLERRVAYEGESFITKTLPAFGKAVDLGLQGLPLTQSLFKVNKRKSALPLFLGGLLSRIFGPDGYVLDHPCIVAIRLVRQLCYYAKKIEKGYSAESLRHATEEFISIDAALPEVDFCFDSPLVSRAKAIVDSLFSKLRGLGSLLPKHGPGAVASGGDAVEKRKLAHCYTDLERIFRPIPFFFSLRDASEDPARIYGRIRCTYGLSRTEFVNKDSGGPRTIGLEPAEYMWCQQAVKSLLYDYIETQSFAGGQINFTDQSINRELTRNWLAWDTLDMSKASDRNSYALVKSLFVDTAVWPLLDACRTPGTVLPDGRILMYKKYAPMGSAVCFPVQAVVYYALACAALFLDDFRKPGERPSLKKYAKEVFVYGDDLVVPHGRYDVLKDAFESVGLKFNNDKCCTSGRFRESCGLDAYNGEDVTPVRLRKPYAKIPKGIDPCDFGTGAVALSALIPVIEHHNQLVLSGYWNAASAYRMAAMEAYPHLALLRLPVTPIPNLPILSWLSDEPCTLRVYKRHSMWMLKGWVHQPAKVDVPAALEERLLRESLALGGPVGHLAFSSARSKKAKCIGRRLSLKYTGNLVYKELTVHESQLLH